MSVGEFLPPLSSPPARLIDLMIVAKLIDRSIGRQINRSIDHSMDRSIDRSRRSPSPSLSPATHMFDLATNAQFNPGSCSGDFPTNQGTRIIPAPSVPFNPHFIPIPPLGQRMPSVARPWNYGCLPWLTPGSTDAFRSSPLELRMPSVAHPWSYECLW